MKLFKVTSIICLCLAGLVSSAPADLPEMSNEISVSATTTTTPATTSFTTTTSAPTSSSTTTTSTTSAPTTSAQTSTASDLTSSAPATEGAPSQQAGNSTSPMDSTQSHNDSNFKSSSFTCYGKSIGYYADMEQNCRVYHFCLLGDYNGDSVYQRITYLCLNETVFDQQALDCVESSKMSAPCTESTLFYDSSNAVLRQAVVGSQMMGNRPVDATNTAATHT